MAREWNARMRLAQRALSGQKLFYAADRVGHQLFQCDAPVGDAVDERGVGTAFQQAPHQIGQQRFVAAYRGVNPAWAAATAATLARDQICARRDQAATTLQS